MHQETGQVRKEAAITGVLNACGVAELRKLQGQPLSGLQLICRRACQLFLIGEMMQKPDEEPLDNSMSYKDAGVDVELGDTCSEIMFNASRETWKNREGSFGEILGSDNFSGIRYVKFEALKQGLIFGSNSDGVGSKVEIAQRLEKHDTIAFDLVAMLVDDAARDGAEPVFMSNVLDVNSLKNNVDYVRQLAKGLISAAREANIGVINGEIAELGELVSGYGSFCYNWSGTLSWIAQKDQIVDGKDILPGQKIVALREDGFRSNGFSLVRKIMEDNFGYEWHEKQPNLALQILEPSKIYSGLIFEFVRLNELYGRPVVSGIAHITGGGIPEKLSRLLRRKGLGAVLDDLFEPCYAIKRLQELGKVSDEEAYKTWNMGQGMLVITENPDLLLDVSEKYNTGPNHKFDVKVVGRVKETPAIEIKSKGIFKKEKVLRF